MTHQDPIDLFAKCQCPACSDFVAEYERAGYDETGDDCESAWQRVRADCPTYAVVQGA